MWLTLKYMVCFVLSADLGEATFVLGSIFIKRNRDYTVAVFNIHNSSERLLLRLEGTDYDGRPLLNLTQTTDVQPHTIKMITFKIPSNVTKGNYSIITEGDDIFHKYPLEYGRSFLSGLIQLSKPVIMPDETLRFRVIVLDIDLKPPPLNETTVSVLVQDPNRDMVQQWINVSLLRGVFENQITISTIPVLGTYQIKVTANDYDLVVKSFEVANYELHSIDLKIYPTVAPCVVDQALNLTVDIRNYLGVPLRGNLTIRVYFHHPRYRTYLIAWTKKLDVNGMRQFHLPFKRKLVVLWPDLPVHLSVETEFTEQYQDRTTIKNHTIEVYPSKYKVSSDILLHRLGSTFTPKLKVTHLNGDLAKNITVRVVVDGYNSLIFHDQDYTSDMAGGITFSMQTNESMELAGLKVIDNTEYIVSESIITVEVQIFLDVKLLTRVKFNRMVRLMVTCSHGMDALLYIIISKGNIVDVGFYRPNQMTRYSFQVLVSKFITVNDLGNNLEIKIEENISEDGVDPGDEIELAVRGRPGAFVSLIAYDQRLMQHSVNHDIFLNDLWAVFDQFLPESHNDFDLVARVGLSAEVVGIYGGSRNYRGRGIYPDAPRVGMPGPYRSEFYESWLWQNMIIPPSGRIGLEVTVPHSITSWYITGFVIDPVYGLGMVNKPVTFSTAKLFFIYDHLPNFFIRGKTTSLHFTLFSKLDEEFEATVTIINAKNQIQLVDHPIGEMKNVPVPPNITASVSFLIKPMKLGEVEIWVNASIMQGVISDSFKKIITVIPEELVMLGSKRINFYHDTPVRKFYETYISVPWNMTDMNNYHDIKISKLYETYNSIPWNVKDVYGQFYFTVHPELQSFRNVSNNFNLFFRFHDIPITMYVHSNSVIKSKTYSVRNVQMLNHFAAIIDGSGSGFIEVNMQCHISVINTKHSFNVEITKVETAIKWLKQLKVCCNFISWKGVDYSNDTMVEVSIPIGYTMDGSHMVVEGTTVNPISRIEVLHGGTTLKVCYNKMGNETNCFSVFAYRRYRMPLKRPSYIKVQDSSSPELHAMKMFDFY